MDTDFGTLSGGKNEIHLHSEDCVQDFTASVSDFIGNFYWPVIIHHLDFLDQSDGEDVIMVDFSVPAKS